MKKQDIIDAYIEIRKTNNTIPDDVLDFMKKASIERLTLINTSVQENPNEYSLTNLQEAFEGGRKSIEPVMKAEPYGNLDWYASFRIVKSFKQWKHENFNTKGRINKKQKGVKS